MDESSRLCTEEQEVCNKELGNYLLHSYICSNLSTVDREKNLYPDLVPTAKDLDK